MKMKLDLSKFKKISQDDTTAVLQHPDGHRFHVAIQALHPANRKNLDSLQMAGGGNPKLEESKKTPRMDDGGEVSKDNNKDKLLKENKVSHDLPESGAAAQYAEGGMVSGYANSSNQATSLKENYPKKKHNYADGGEIPYDKLIPQEQADNAPYGTTPTPPVTVNVNSDQSPMPGVASQAAQSEQALASPPQPVPADQPKASQPQPIPAEPNKVPVEAPTTFGGYAKEAQGIQQQAEAEAKLAQEQSTIQKSKIDAALNNKEQFDAKYKELETERQALQHDIASGHIDPNRYMGSLDTEHRAYTIIGLALGGMSGGPNLAFQALQNNIDRDIAAQRADLGRKENLLSANLRQFGNLNEATQMTRVMQNDIISGQLQQAIDKAQSPIAKANGQKLLGQLQMQSAPMVQQMAMRQMLYSQPQGGLVNTDPSEFVTSMVPSDKQKEVFGQIEAAQNTRQMAGSIMKSFDDAAKENTMLRTGGGLLRTPASVYALHQSMQPTFKDLEGTVRQAAMDNTFKNITPMPGDADSTISTKRKALTDYLQSKASAPMAKGYGIDLERFESTAAKPESRLNPQQAAFAQWAKANPNDKRAAAVLKKLGLQ